MKKKQIYPSMVLIAGLLLAGYGPAGADNEEYSGFLKDYSGLEKYKDPAGNQMLREISPKFTPANYHALIIEPIQLFPEPEPNEKVSQSTLDDLVTYINTELKARMATKVEVTDKPGSGVARLRIAVTGVGAKTQDLKPYQYIPVALVLTAVKRATTGAPEDAKLYIEGEATDSVSGERLMITVRKGTGEALKASTEGEKVVTLDTLKPLVDKWIDGTITETDKFIKSK